MKSAIELIERSGARFDRRKNKITPVQRTISNWSDKKLEKGFIRDINTKYAIDKRSRYIARRFGSNLDVTKERVLGNPDFVHVNYMEKGLKAARSIGRVVIKNSVGSIKGHGTGFLISPNILLTNNHVLETASESAYSEVEFNYEYDINGRLEPYYSYKLRPDLFYISSPYEDLDYTAVAVSTHDINGQKPVTDFGFLPLIKETGKIAIGENVSIIQHPNSGFKQIAMRENRLIDKDPTYLRYSTDTQKGSSGSAVFNDQWEVVALHHAGVPERDVLGKILKKDGSIWNAATDDDSEIHWIANEGIRISRIVKDILRQLDQVDPSEFYKKELVMFF